MKNWTPEQKRFVLVGSFVLLVSLLVLMGVVVIIQNFTKNPFGSAITMAGYDQTIQTLPKEYKDSFDAMLYKIVALNSGDKKASGVRDASIRVGSHKVKTATDSRHAGLFIVDIPSLRQSYEVQYEYTSNVRDNFTSGYPLLISCPKKDQLRYGDFQCKDIYSQKFETVDPITTQLPHETIDYVINSVVDENNDTSLVVTIYLSMADVSNPQQKVERVKADVMKWLQSKAIDPSVYEMRYQTKQL